MTLLALFDVDGTLFLTDDPLSGQAFVAALRDVYPVEPPADAVERANHRGQTSLRIAREVLRAEDVGDAAIDARLSDWCARFAERYVSLLESADTSGWQASPGARAALARLGAAGIRLALLTGNPEPVARARMKRLGLEEFFPPGQGAFGCEAEGRKRLLDLARERAGSWPATRTVEIGDTARDVASAHADGIRSIAVRSPRGEEPPGADAICGDLDEVASVLLAWNR
jgi:phosphoglycolate phosphatase-like HAD superfamily hydrolase